MVQTLDVYDMKKTFVDLDRDYFSLTGLEALLELYDEIDPNTEFDPIGICCDWNEYGDDDCALEYADLVHDYGYFYPEEEFRQDCGEDDPSFDDYVSALLDHLEDKTYIMRLANGNCLLQCF